MRDGRGAAAPMLYSARHAMSLLLSPTATAPDVVVLPDTGLAFGRTAVTRAQYAGFLDAGQAEPPPWWSHPAFSAASQPVVGVTWFEAVAYAEWLVAIAGGSWRLPTADEWEHAARGGLVAEATPWGRTIPEGEIPEGPLEGPWRTGLGAPNGFGLLDMGTIVHEWCLDARGKEGERRASCGGSWRHHVRFSPPSGRSSLPPSCRYADYGFRVVRGTA